MLTKRLVSASFLALVLGAFVIALPLQSNFALLEQYQFEADIVYVYLKVFNITEDTPGLGRLTMLSYIVVLNVTNPTDKTIRMRDIDLYLGGSVKLKEAPAKGYTITGGLLSFYRYFPQGNIDYFWWPNVSMLLVLSGVRETNPDLVETTLNSLLEMRGRTPEGAIATTDYVTKPIQLETSSANEFVYDTTFGARRFHHTDDGVGISLEG